MKHIPRCKTAIWSFDTDALASYDLICAEGTSEHLPRPYLVGLGDFTQALSLAAALGKVYIWRSQLKPI